MSSLKKDPIAEANRYLENADWLLEEKCPIKDGYYSDSKYVKMAGDTAWKGILMALEPFLPATGKNSRKSVDSYRDVLAKRNKKLLNAYNNAYQQLHLFMGYDGATDPGIKKLGWKHAKEIISWAKTSLSEKESGKASRKKATK